MPRLQLVFNCLHMFVADEANDVVHVVMPATQDHHDHHKHEVRIFHNSFVGDEKVNGRSMNGWALVLGKTPDSDKGAADTSFVPSQPSGLDDVLVDLSTITDKRVPVELVENEHHPQVAARVSLYGGRVTRLTAEAEYLIKGKIYALAHQVIWEILDVPHDLEWVPLNPQGREPISSLNELPTEPNLGYRLEIDHVSRKSLPRGRGVKLKPAEMAEHFAMFFPLLGLEPADPELLPRLIGRTDGVNCGGTRAKLAR